MPIQFAPENNPAPRASPSLGYRELVFEDWKPIYEYWQHETFYKYCAVPVPTEEYVQGEVSRYLKYQVDNPRNDFYFAITEKTTERLIGLVSARRLLEAPDRAEIGFSIHHDFWGRGYATEAGRSIIEFCRAHLQTNTIIAHAVTSNTASHAVLQKLGFADLGLIANPKEIRGDFPHANIYELPLISPNVS